MFGFLFGLESRKGKILMYHLLDLHFFKINDLFLNACLTRIL